MPSEDQRLRALARARKHHDKALEEFTLAAMEREGYPEKPAHDFSALTDAVKAMPNMAPEPPPEPPASVETVVKEEARRRAPVKRQAPPRAKRSPKKTPRKRGR